MRDVLSILSSLKRPKLLIRAARIGAQDYRRNSHLPRLLGYGALPRSSAAVFKLMEIEQDLNDQRKTADAGYDLIRHVDVVIAIIGEAHILRASQSFDHIKLSGSAALRSAT
ncbi:MAG: hypothetical protein ACJAVM_000315 [Sulfitobacter sp.]|jgi:Family of unknown function (DUF6477)